MLDLVKYLVTNIADLPDQVKVEDAVDETGTHLITITVDESDMGKVIGKGGKIISAIRELTKVKAIKKGERVRITLVDPKQPESTETNLPSPPEPEAPQS